MLQEKITPRVRCDEKFVQHDGGELWYNIWQMDITVYRTVQQLGIFYPSPDKAKASIDLNHLTK